MNTAPPELLYALVFGAFLLLQFLVKRFGRLLLPADPPPEAPLPETEPPAPGHWGRAPELPAEWAVLPKAPAVGTANARLGPASRLLLSGGPDLRRAIVCMTLLGPCRGQEPDGSR